MYNGNLSGTGSMRDQLRFFRNDNTVNEYSEPVVSTRYIVQSRGNVRIRKSTESDKFGTTISTRVITVKMWYDKNITEDMTMDWVNDSGRYTVKRVDPDERKRYMIVTAFLEARVMYSPPVLTPIGDTATELDPILVPTTAVQSIYVIDHSFPVTPTVIFTNENGDEVAVSVEHVSPTMVQVTMTLPIVGLITVKSGV